MPKPIIADLDLIEIIGYGPMAAQITRALSASYPTR